MCQGGLTPLQPSESRDLHSLCRLVTSLSPFTRQHQESVSRPSQCPPDRAGPLCRALQRSPRLRRGLTPCGEHPEPSRQVPSLRVKVASVLRSSASGLLKTHVGTDTGHRNCLMPRQATPRHHGSRDPARAVTLPQQWKPPARGTQCERRGTDSAGHTASRTLAGPRRPENPASWDRKKGARGWGQWGARPGTEKEQSGDASGHNHPRREPGGSL